PPHFITHLAALVTSHNHADLTSFFFNHTPTTEIYTLSLHDALPISCSIARWRRTRMRSSPSTRGRRRAATPARRLRYSPKTSRRDRKSTRLNSSHSQISYAVFCLKKKKKKNSRTDYHH